LPPFYSRFPPFSAVGHAVTIQRLVLNGAGLGVLSAHLRAPGIAAGTLVGLFPEWAAPPAEVGVVFPGDR
jgi:DNA-binding transcriptional LysR family regulator